MEKKKKTLSFSKGAQFKPECLILDCLLPLKQGRFKDRGVRWRLFNQFKLISTQAALFFQTCSTVKTFCFLTCICLKDMWLPILGKGEHGVAQHAPLQYIDCTFCAYLHSVRRHNSSPGKVGVRWEEGLRCNWGLVKPACWSHDCCTTNHAKL